jgi:putative membrane protein
MMWWRWGGGGGWEMLFGGIISIIFLAAIIWLIVWAVQRSSHGSSTPGNRSPLDIAKERYARGEITKEQFDQLKKDLGS